MANEAIIKQAPEQTPGEATAAKLEKAVTENNSASFRNAMDEVTAYRASHKPEEANQYMQDMSKKLKADDMLPQLAIFNTKFEFNNLDTNHDGKLSKAELSSGAIQHPVESKLLDRANKMMSKDSIDMDDLNEAQINEVKDRAERAQLRQLFTPGTDGKSLYDRISNQKDGSVSQAMIESYLTVAATNAAQLKLSPADIKALEFLKPLSNGWSRDNLNKDEIEALRKRITDD